MEDPAKTVIPAPAIRAGRLYLVSDASLETAAAEILRASLDHFEANLRSPGSDDDIERIHQMRVALRRLRAAIGLLRGAVDGAALETARARAKSIASAMGETRDWDVFLEHLRAGPAAAEKKPDFSALFGRVDALRAQARAAANAALDDAQTETFVMELRAAIATRDWRIEPALCEAGAARIFAARALKKLRARVLRKSRKLASLSPEARHDARIALKKARYGAEFFESLFAHHKQARAFSLALSRLQDGLGLYNDLQTAHALLDRIEADGNSAVVVASAFARGWFAHAGLSADAHARKSEKALKQLAPFWE